MKFSVANTPGHPVLFDLIFIFVILGGEKMSLGKNDYLLNILPLVMWS